MTGYLAFEKPVEALASAAALRRAGGREGEAIMLDERAARLLADLYGRLTPWQRTQVARHPARPHFHHLVAGMFDDFIPLAGDRTFADDKAIQGGLARFQGLGVVVIGHVKGDDAEGRVRHNSGMGRPEGYRKAVRLMELANRFGLPVITLVDTPGAFLGIDAEQRGQAAAVALCIQKCLSLDVPMIAIIVGEGGAAGAVALAAANRVLMLEHAIYSVISPEGCASILWYDPDRAPDAAEAMKITATELLRAGVIHRIVYEPTGGAHRNHGEMINRLSLALAAELQTLTFMTPRQLQSERRTFFMQLGAI